MQTLSHKKPKAQKEHRCDFCNNKIVVGQIYNNSTHIASGNIYTWKAHIYCSDLASDLRWYDEYSDGLTMDAFMENVKYAFQDLHIKFDRDYYESDEFEYPSFLEQLDFVVKNKSFISIK